MHFLVPLQVEIPIGRVTQHKLRMAFGLSPQRYVSFEPFTEVAPKGFGFYAVVEVHKLKSG
jgi:hypothetical protein